MRSIQGRSARADSLPPFFPAAIAGFVATVAQTLAMELVRVRMPLVSPGRFPPRQVAEGIVAQLVGQRQPPSFSEPVWLILTTISHFAYGTASAVLYPIIGSHERSVRGGPLRRGSMFGLLVWAESYLVLLPALGIRTPQADQPIRKNIQLIIAHLAWGVSLVVVYEWLQKQITTKYRDSPQTN